MAAREIDPEYALELERAAAGGVEILPQAVALEARPGPEGLWSLSWDFCPACSPGIGECENGPGSPTMEPPEHFAFSTMMEQPCPNSRQPPSMRPIGP